MNTVISNKNDLVYVSSKGNNLISSKRNLKRIYMTSFEFGWAYEINIVESLFWGEININLILHINLKNIKTSCLKVY